MNQQCKISQQRKNHGPGDITGKFYEILKEEFISVLSQTLPPQKNLEILVVLTLPCYQSQSESSKSHTLYEYRCKIMLLAN